MTKIQDNAESTTENITENASYEELLARVTALEGEKTSILGKNSELIDREKKAKDAVTAATSAANAAIEQAATATGNVEQLKQALETQWSSTVKERDDAISALNARLSTITIDKTIAEAMVANNVSPVFAEMTALRLKQGTALSEDGTATRGGIPIADSIALYFASDEGKAVISAPKNVGSGATGPGTVSGGGFTAETFTYDAFNKLAGTNPAQANAFALQFGKKWKA
jgi:hypothetical protein